MPANGTAGYELLDSLSGLGPRRKCLMAAYWRAKEGELGRGTIAANPGIRSARVHLFFQFLGSRPFSVMTVATGNPSTSHPPYRDIVGKRGALRFSGVLCLAGTVGQDAVTVITAHR